MLLVGFFMLLIDRIVMSEYMAKIVYFFKQVTGVTLTELNNNNRRSYAPY